MIPTTKGGWIVMISAWIAVAIIWRLLFPETNSIRSWVITFSLYTIMGIGLYFRQCRRREKPKRKPPMSNECDKTESDSEPIPSLLSTMLGDKA